ncbi:MAG TPA: helix-turn-helix domain-containing protein, partial [Nocardioidaceae bacterium]|nr:helix-turn-helix domain-containing protein [Nocardioidaceae bacterium]
MPNEPRRGPQPPVTEPGQHDESSVHEHAPEQGAEQTAGQTQVAGTPVVVRRRAGLAALVGGAASAVAIAYLWRAAQTMAPLDWALCLVMAGIASVYLAALVDARTPLLVADDLGVRIRFGHEWRGLPWEAVAEVTVRPRRGLLRDGRIGFAPHNPARALDGLDARGRRHARANQRLLGTALAVPVGLSTRVRAEEGLGLTEALARLVGPTTVVTGPPAPVVTSAEPAEDGAVDRAADGAAEAGPVQQPGDAALPTPGLGRETDRAEDRPEEQRDADVALEDRQVDETQPRLLRHSVLGGIGTIVSRVGKGRQHDVDSTEPVPTDPTDPANVAEPTEPAGRADVAEPAEPAAARSIRTATRADVVREAAKQPVVSEARGLHRPGRVDLVFEAPTAAGRVRPISTLGEAVEPLVIDDFVTEPAYDPVVGPELAAARTRLGLSVDELSERTRIRPHVIESIEVDDFAPCGGDFYARGHLRTLARVLGKDPAPLLAAFEERYAAAPVSARRVFEAELATGAAGGLRSTIGGPSWGLLVGVVVCLALVWGVVRLFSADTTGTVPAPGSALSGAVAPVQPQQPGQSEQSGQSEALEALPLRLEASDDSRVVVRDGSGEVVYRGRLGAGQHRRLEAVPPVR